MHKSAVIACIIWVMVSAAVFAQDTSPPVPELKDFRLDKPVPSVTGPVDPAPVGETKPEPAKKAVEPPTSAVAVPKSEPKIEAKVQDSEPRPVAQPPQRVTKPGDPRATITNLPQTAAPAPDADGASPAAELIADPVSESLDAGPGTGPDTATTTEAPDIAPSPNTTAPEPGVDFMKNPLVPALIGASAVGILIFLGWLWNRRRRRAESDADTEDTLLLEPEEALELGFAQTPMSQPDPAPEFDPAADAVPTPPITRPIDLPTILPVAASVAPDPPAQNPVQQTPLSEIDLAFTPDRVVISFNSLTLYGDLAIQNRGQSAAFDIQLQTELTSANANQQDDIAGFLANGLDAQKEPLDNIAPGEKINLALALVLPLAELNSFAIGTQKLTVPILLARLDFRSGKGKTAPRAVETLSCLIGREASPPTPKMGPLRLDTGTRSYTGLGQRNLAA